MRCKNRSASIVNVTPAPGSDEAHALPQRMHARIGTTGTRRRRPPTGEALQDGFEIRLHRAPSALPLPPDEPTPVVVDHGEEGPARHERKIGRNGGPIKPRNPLSHLTKGDFAG